MTARPSSSVLTGYLVPRPMISFCNCANAASAKSFSAGCWRTCVSNQSHLRDLLEQGFEVVVARDATAAPRHPEWGYGYTAALINFAFLAHAVLTTDDVVKAMQ